MTARHTLTIEPGEIGGMTFRGTLVFQDGTDRMIYADERARVIAQAQRLVEQYHQREAMHLPRRETLTLDEFGELVHNQERHSMKVGL